jgi:O-acetyl-ADP-ribose deacetylase (regulator of RNase III)
MTRLVLIKGDITEQEVDAIVNPANKWLGRGGGVTGSIHRKAGPSFTEECARIGRCETGEVKLTRGHNLPAKHVIHTVGPEYGYENGKEAEILKQCYKNVLKFAESLDFKTIALPALSVGSFRYPAEEATPIAIEVIKNHLRVNNHFNEIRLVVFSDEIFLIYKTQITKNSIN